MKFINAQDIAELYITWLKCNVEATEFRLLTASSK